ncbi:hypothetical protein ACE1B6_07000 [Aerosakkonemataceae cyanobacterium BLCC-F154]|uniref:Uncharacterized protein n=1 Tax=Floridaenema fluviatile BLCC-F154 TaxID=3153640 RepID=A0ABV4YAU1_9CYAN
MEKRKLGSSDIEITQTNAITGARHAKQIEENAIAAQVKLSPEDLAEIDAIGRTVTDPLENEALMWDWS